MTEDQNNNINSRETQTQLKFILAIQSRLTTSSLDAALYNEKKILQRKASLSNYCGNTKERERERERERDRERESEIDIWSMFISRPTVIISLEKETDRDKDRKGDKKKY